MKILHGFLLLIGLSVSGAASADPPFCVVTSYGDQCWYYDANTCRNQAAQHGGMCVLAADRRSGARSNTAVLDVVDQLQRGEQAAIQKRESEARIALLQAQAEAVRAANTPAPSQPSYTVIYSCPSDVGPNYQSEFPLIGCVVTDIKF